MRFSLLCGLGLLALVFPAINRAQTSPGVEAPLVSPEVSQFPDAAGAALRQLAGWRALEIGLPSVAIEVFRARLAAVAPEDGEQRNRIVLELATALLDDGRAAEIAEALRGYVGPPTDGYRLRMALADIRLKRSDDARRELKEIAPDRLERGERGWFYFAQGQLAGDAKAGSFYQQAYGSAVTDLQRARFALALREIDLISGVFTEAALAEMRSRLERSPGTAAGYIAMRQIAVALNGLGRKSEAVDFLRQHLQALPFEEKAVGDDLQVLLGLIAGTSDPVGRNALMQVLATSGDREKQRVALLLLARNAQQAGFRGELDRLIGASPAHPILEELLVQRAELNLVDKKYREAETDAKRMLEAFPGSRLKPQALGILVKVAWEFPQYRRAADYAAQARAALTGPGAGQVRSELGVLIAEAYFRAPDYRLAADAYATALEDVPQGVNPGALIFQRIYSEIESAQSDPDRLAAAAELLDEASKDPRLDETNRWQAEWNLARAMRAAGAASTRAAFNRVDSLLRSAPQATGSTLPQDLRVRMAWLRARLSLEVGEPSQTLVFVDNLIESLDGVDAALKTEIASTARLVQADAHFHLSGQEKEGLEILQKLRVDFPQSDAAVESYLLEAERAANQNRYVDAQSLLVKLRDDFPRHRYAPFALFQAALYAEKRGQDTYYHEAYRLLEDLLKAYPGSDLVFYARLKQGDLLRLLNEFNPAQQIYELLVNNFPRHPDVLYAYLALAAAHNAQANGSSMAQGQLSNHAEAALSIYERLVDQADAGPDLRIEAGYNLGLLLTRRGNAESKSRAEIVWWQQVVTPFLLDDSKAGQLTGGGRYFMSRTLLGLGELLEAEGKLEQAREAYMLIINRRLPGDSIASGRLARFGVKLGQTEPSANGN
ncbi:MAG: tetratricopeptide repeat protein [Opitutaceae bacterium]|nr:tetratricopeptide repeat protein [Opitutaceae bacterium]